MANVTLRFIRRAAAARIVSTASHVGPSPRDAEVQVPNTRPIHHSRGLTGYKIPHEVITGAVPRNRSGKILKHKLREAITQQQATAS